MSSHYKFEVHIKAPGEDDDEAKVERYAECVRKLSASWTALGAGAGLEITVGDVERS